MKPSRQLAGSLGAVSAFLLWGLLPLYWKPLQHIPAYEILCHRIVWSMVVTVAALVLMGRLKEVLTALRNGRTLRMLLLSASLITANWFLYIWAVTHNFVLETSLGYYITPLVNALLGTLFLRERLDRFQIVAVTLATAGVLNQLIGYTGFPWVALILAFTFGAYGLVRKVVQVEALPGLCVETLIVSIPAGFYLLWLAVQGTGALGNGSFGTDLLLLGSGPATTMPLVLFAFAARRIMLTTLGIFQFIAPSCAFLLGVFVFKEPFTSTHLVTFALIWSAVVIYAYGAVYAARHHKQRK